jgi:L-alanine-DL-glutamate epimerase-like enolase superfamily enzyme
MVHSRLSQAPIREVDTEVFVVPTDRPEADGTARWNSTVLVVVHVEAGSERGLGLSYASRASARVVHEKLRDTLRGLDALDLPACWQAMVASVRNLGRPGAASMAISAVDLALWDLKAKLLGLPLARLLGMARTRVPAYGSGGFTSYSVAELERQVGDWAQQGFGQVKMKVGEAPDRDGERVAAARRAIGERVRLHVDANGAYTRRQALRLGEQFAAFGVDWLEEPVSSDDLEGLRFVRERCAGGMRVAAGEYGFDPPYFRKMLESQAVDVLQADITRCLGGTGFLKAAALAEAFFVPLSSHCGPAMHLPFACHAAGFTELEWFHDHARIEGLLFDGAPVPRGGMLSPDLSRPGFGLELKRRDAMRFAA